MIDFRGSIYYMDPYVEMRTEDTMKDKPKAKKGRSRVFFAVWSLVCPGLGQILRGRILTGLLFLLNVVLYVFLVFAIHDIGYDVRTPFLVTAGGVYVFCAMDAFLQKSSFLVLAMLVSLFCFGAGFFGAYFFIPILDI